MVAQFELTKDPEGAFRFVLRAPNGEVILSSEPYESKDGAMQGIATARANATADDNYRRRTSQAQQFYFVLFAPNNQPIGTSQMYTSTATRERGIHAVKLHAPAANIDDKT